MTLTPAQRQARFRKKRAEKMARYEAALRRIIAHDDPDLSDQEVSANNDGWQVAIRLCADIARQALDT